MEKSVRGIVDKLTLEEKAALCTGTGMWRTSAVARLGVPSIVMTDGTNGVRHDAGQIAMSVEQLRDSELLARGNGGVESDVDHFFAQTEFIDLNQDSAMLVRYDPATCIPTGSAIACSWDRDLMEEIGRVIGEECQHFGVNVLLGPGVNIRRTPLGGRGYEYYSEDPLEAGELGAAFVRGIQGMGVGACVKHFACNNSEYQRTVMSSDVDERALWEIYLRAFERIVRSSKPWMIMSSYNRLNGVQAAENRFLLTEVLRDHMGFEGVVTSDWWGIKDRVAAARAGNDLQMPENPNDRGLLVRAVREGALDESVLDDLCARIVELAFKAKKNERPSLRVDFMAHHQLARRAAAESIVLLKNEGGILPIDPEHVSSIAVVGSIAMNPRYQGAGCATIHPTFLSVPLEEIRKKAGDAITVRYAEGYTQRDETDDALLKAAKEVAQKSDMAVIFAGLAVAADTEGSDRPDLEIAESHRRLIEAVCSVQKKLVVVLSNGDAVTMDPWIGKVAGVVDQFYSGQAGGAAIADVLFGDTNPSGKLTVTFPARIEDTPAFLHYPGENGHHLYGEGIFVGYRYYDKRAIAPLFPFGFGLSYTSFAYAKLRVANARLREDQILEISFDVTNTGTRSGKEIVQAYVSAPGVRFKRPPRELKAFSKVFIEPGATVTVKLAIPCEDLSCWDPQSKSWVVEPGDYTVFVGASSRDLCLSAPFAIANADAAHPVLRLDSVHSELFANPRAKEIYTEYLTKKGILTSRNRDKVLAVMENSFVGIYNHLTGLLYQEIPRAEVQEVLDRINRESGVVDAARGVSAQ